MEEAFVALLLASAGVQALAYDRVTWVKRDQDAALPAVVLHRIAGAPEYHLTGQSSLFDSVVQADCWGETYAQAKLLARAVKAAVSAHADANFQGLFVMAERDDVEPPADGLPEIHRTSLDVRVWSLVS